MRRPGPIRARWLILFAAALPVHAATDRLEQYGGSAELTLGSPGQGLYRVQLPLAVLQQSRSVDARDVRVFNAAGEPVPVGWAGTPPAVATEPRQVRLPHFAWPAYASPSGEQASEVRIELGPQGAVLRVERSGKPGWAPSAASATATWLLDLAPLGAEKPSAVVLHWAPEPFALVVGADIESSADAQTWHAAGRATLLDVPASAQGSAIVERRVEIASLVAQARYLRIRLAQAMRLERVDAELAVQAPPVALESARFLLQQDGVNAWTLDTGTALKVRRMQLHLAQDNSVAPLQIARRAVDAFDSRSPQDWLPVASHTAYRLVRDGASLQSPSFTVAEHNTREWRFSLDARVSPPSSPPEITLWWNAPKLLFAARGAGPFRLAVGRDHAPATALDRSVLVPGYRQGDEFALPAATVGSLTVRTPAGTWLEVFDQVSAEAYRRWLLWAVLGAAVVALCALAWKLSHDLASTPGGRGPTA